MSCHPIGRFSCTMVLRMHRPHSAVLPRVAIVATALVILGTACSSNGSSATCGSGPKLLPSSPTALPTLDAHAFRQLLCQLHGKPVVMVIPCWVGDIDGGERFVKPLKDFGSPVADLCTPKPFLTHQSMFDPSFVPGRWYYFKSCDVPELTDEVIDITMERSLQINSPLTSYPIWQMGGAVSRVEDGDTAFNGRQAGFTYNIGCATETEEGFADERDWVRSFWSALEPWHTTVYVNFLGDEGEERIRTAYGAKKYDRLKALKQKYDPDNFFRINQNIPPAR